MACRRHSSIKYHYFLTNFCIKKKVDLVSRVDLLLINKKNVTLVDYIVYFDNVFF